MPVINSKILANLIYAILLDMSLFSVAFLVAWVAHAGFAGLLSYIQFFWPLCLGGAAMKVFVEWATCSPRFVDVADVAALA